MANNRTPRGGGKSAPGGRPARDGAPSGRGRASGGSGGPGGRSGGSSSSGGFGERSSRSGGPGERGPGARSGGPGGRSGGPGGRAAAGPTSGSRSRFSAEPGAPRTGGGRPADKRDLTGKPVGGRPGRPERSERSDRPARGDERGRPAPRRTERTERADRLERTAPRRRDDEVAGFDDEEELGGVGQPDMPNDIVFGRHAVLAALEGNQTINKVWILNGLKNQTVVTKVRQMAKEKGASIQMVERVKLDTLTNEANHQGLVVSLAAAAYVDLEDVIAKALEQKYPAILLLDGIEDPHNLGALIRSAEAAGFTGVVIPNRRAVGVTPVAAKTSAGATSRVPIARVGNLATAATAIKKAGFWLIGAEGEAEKTPYEIDMTVPLCLVIGAEGKGLSRLMGDKCDFLVKLPMEGQMESLNASVAGGILMYEAVRQRQNKQ